MIDIKIKYKVMMFIHDVIHDRGNLFKLVHPDYHNVQIFFFMIVGR